MPTLTADQITSYRDLIGDECGVAFLTDPMLQTAYDRAIAFDFDIDTTEAVTIIYALRRIWGKVRAKVAQSGDFPSGNNDIFNNIKIMLDYYGGIAGLGGFASGGMGRISTGTLNLGIDWTEADSEAEWLDA